LRIQILLANFAVSVIIIAPVLCAACFLGFDSGGRQVQSGGQPWVGLKVSVKATPCELLGGYQERKPGMCCAKVGDNNPLARGRKVPRYML